MLSVNTNYSAMIALQNLNGTNKDLEEVQNRINTGFKVATAKDNGAVFAIAEGQRARMTSLGAVTDAINRASSAIDVALKAGESIGQILKELKTKAVAAQAEDLTTDQRNAIQADFDALRARIDQIANSAQFNGINLISAGGSDLQVLVSDLATGTSGRQVTSTAVAGTVPALSAYVVGNGSVTDADDTTFNINGVAIGTVDITATMTIQEYIDAVSTQTGGRVTATYNQSTGTFVYTAPEATSASDLSLTTAGTARTWLGHGVAAADAAGATVTTTITDMDWTVGGTGALTSISTAANVLSTASGSATVSGQIDTALTALNRELATLGSQSKALDIQHDFLVALSDTVEKGIGNLVDADLAKESARLQSLQIKQQLGAQALSIANQSPQVILSLFRG